MKSSPDARLGQGVLEIQSRKTGLGEAEEVVSVLKLKQSRTWFYVYLHLAAYFTCESPRP